MQWRQWWWWWSDVICSIDFCEATGGIYKARWTPSMNGKLNSRLSRTVIHRLLSLWLIEYWLRWTGIFIVEQSIVRWNWIKVNWWRQPITHASTCDATSRSSIVVTRSNRKLLYTQCWWKLDIRTLFRPISLS